MSDTANAEKIVNRHVLWSIGAGLMPLPILDIVAVTAIQLDMLKQLASEHAVDFSDSEGKAWVTALAGNLVARVGAGALKFIPGIGSLVGGLSASIVSGASTYALGRVATRHFQSGGNLADLDVDAARRVYEEELERGKAVAKDLANEKKDSLDKLERLAKLRDKGVITPEEFEEQKKRVLASM
jgi:uncharacterized protein (DUF697 family)